MRFKLPGTPAFSVTAIARHRAEAYLSTLFLLLALLCPIWLRAQSQPPAGVPSAIHECEGTLCSNWAWDNGHYDANWQNGAIATLTVPSFTTDSVVIVRTDTPNSYSAGLTAQYTGQISSDGSSIVNGKVTWTWPGRRGYPATGKWTGTWEVPPQPKIMFIGTNVDITGTTQPVVVGQEIALYASYTLPGGLRLQSQSWSLPSTIPIVGDYSVAPDSSSGKVVAARFDGPTTNFHFLDGGRGRSITYSYILSNGQRASATVTFDVFGPTSPSISTINSHTITVRDNLLEFGDFTKEHKGKYGIRFTGAASEAPGYPGTFLWVQIIESDVTILKSSARPVVCKDIEVLDFSYPFATGPVMDDSPNTALGGSYLEESTKTSLRTYLMWRPARPDAIPVPLGYVRWGWYGDAKYDSLHAIWVAGPSNGKTWNNESKMIDIYPEWTAKLGDGTCPP